MAFSIGPKFGGSIKAPNVAKPDASASENSNKAKSKASDSSAARVTFSNNTAPGDSPIKSAFQIGVAQQSGGIQKLQATREDSAAAPQAEQASEAGLQSAQDQISNRQDGPEASRPDPQAIQAREQNRPAAGPPKGRPEVKGPEVQPRAEPADLRPDPQELVNRAEGPEVQSRLETALKGAVDQVERASSEVASLRSPEIAAANVEAAASAPEPSELRGADSAESPQLTIRPVKSSGGDPVARASGIAAYQQNQNQ